jgi:hypothetical protein
VVSAGRRRGRPHALALHLRRSSRPIGNILVRVCHPGAHGARRSQVQRALGVLP